MKSLIPLMILLAGSLMGAGAFGQLTANPILPTQADMEVPAAHARPPAEDTQTLPPIGEQPPADAPTPPEVNPAVSDKLTELDAKVQSFKSQELRINAIASSVNDLTAGEEKMQRKMTMMLTGIGGACLLAIGIVTVKAKA